MLQELVTIAKSTHEFVSNELFPGFKQNLCEVLVAGSSVSKALGYVPHASDIDVFVLFQRYDFCWTSERTVLGEKGARWHEACEHLADIGFVPSGTNGVYGMANWRLGPINLVFDVEPLLREARDPEQVPAYLRGFDLPQHRAAVDHTGHVYDFVKPGPLEAADLGYTRTTLRRLRMAQARYGVDTQIAACMEELTDMGVGEHTRLYPDGWQNEGGRLLNLRNEGY